MFENLFKTTEKPKEEPQKGGMFDGLFKKEPVKETKKFSGFINDSSWNNIPMTPTLQKLKDAGFGVPTKSILPNITPTKKIEAKPITFLEKLKYLPSAIKEQFTGGEKFPEKMKTSEKIGFFVKELPSAFKEVAIIYAKLTPRAVMRVASDVADPFINWVYDMETPEQPTPSYPIVGEVPTTRKLYSTYREGGYSPLVSGLLTGSDVAMNFAIVLGWAAFFTKKVPVKIKSSEIKIAYEGTKKVAYLSETNKANTLLPKQAQYYKVGTKALLEVVPTKEGTLQMTGFDMTKTQFQNFVKKITNVGFTKTLKTPASKSLVLPEKALDTAMKSLISKKAVPPVVPMAAKAIIPPVPKPIPQPVPKVIPLPETKPKMFEGIFKKPEVVSKITPSEQKGVSKEIIPEKGIIPKAVVIQMIPENLEHIISKERVFSKSINILKENNIEIDQIVLENRIDEIVGALKEIKGKQARAEYFVSAIENSNFESIQKEPKPTKLEKVEGVIPKELEPLAGASPELSALIKIGRGQMRFEGALRESERLAKINKLGGVERVNLREKIEKDARAEIVSSQNEFYNSLNPEFKIGDVVDYQPKMSPQEIKVYGDKKYPIKKVKIIGAEFDRSKSLQQALETGFPTSFKFQDLVVKDIKTGETRRLYPDSIINNKVLSETIEKKSEDVLKELIARQKAPKLAEPQATQPVKEVKVEKIKEAKPAVKEEPSDLQSLLNRKQALEKLRAGTPGDEKIVSAIKRLDTKIKGLKAEKLPEIEKPPIKKETILYAGIPDPGVDKFIAEELRPGINKAIESAKYLGKIIKYIPELMMRVIEPAKLVPGKPYSAVIRGIHHPEAKLVEFDNKRLETIDTNISELEKWYDNNFKDTDLENLMLSRGNPSSADAMRIQADAIKALPKELKLPNQQKVIQEIADFNYKYLQKVAGKDIHKVEDYFYGMYENVQMVDKFLDYWRSTERFIKTKNIPTVADAMDYGLKLKHKNPVANLRAEFRAIAKLEGMTWMREELLRTGKGIYIDEITPAPKEWNKINDPVFKELRVEPNLAKLINSLISTNQISGIPVLNALRKVNNFLRTIKFVGSGFHALVIAKQSLADSGWLGFAYKKTAMRGATFGFKKNDPIFQTKEFKEYVELGGSHKYSIEFQAKRALSDAMDKVYRGNYLGAFTKFGIIPTKIPLGFVNWMFNNYIPKVKYTKYLDFVSAKENKLGRMLTDLEKIEIVKEGQNFYGMMNERLFGRGATATTLLRFVFMAPGYAEGNYRTILKGFSQWGYKGTYGAGRSRFNIVNSLLITGIMATVGTLILTGKSPDKPEKLEDIRDLFKIDTGKKDDRNRRIMIDLMTYDKDYWNVTFNVLRGRPDIAITESIKRVGGMKASTFGMLVDFGQMLQGQAIYDWKEDKIFEITDPFLLKVQKLATHEVGRLEPISVSVYKQLREKEVDAVFAGIASLLGIRSTKSEADKRQQDITNRLFSLRDQQEQLYYYLGSIKDPRKAIENYNKTVNDILGAKLVPQSMRDEWESKLLIDIDRLLSNKVYQLTGPMTKLSKEEKAEEIERIKKYLKNFEVTPDELEKHLKYYWQEHPVENQWSKSHQDNILMRKIRLKERF